MQEVNQGNCGARFFPICYCTNGNEHFKIYFPNACTILNISSGSCVISLGRFLIGVNAVYLLPESAFDINESLLMIHS